MKGRHGCSCETTKGVDTISGDCGGAETVYDTSTMSTASVYRRAAYLIIALLLLLTGRLGVSADELPAGGNVEAAEPAPRVFKTPKTRAAIITVDREIDRVMLGSVKRRVLEARRQHCDVIIFEINAGSGYMTSGLELSKFIREIDLPTVAYVHDTAMGTAALLALACQHIVVAPDASLGNIPPGGSNREEQKTLAAPILADVESSCAKNNTPVLLARAMVLQETVVHEVRRDNEVRYVDTAEKNRLLDEEVRNAEGNRVRAWKYIRQVDSENDYLTLRPGKLAMEMGMARTVIQDDADLLAAMRTVEAPVRLELSFVERLVLWLTTWPVRGTLFVLMLVLAWIEFSHPGISVAGIGALICLALLIGAPYITGLAQAWQIALIVIGVAIIVLDLVFTGGLGFFAIPGFILMAIGIVASFVPAEPGSGWVPSAQQSAGLQRGLGVVVFGSLVSLGLFVFMAKYLYMTPGFRRLQLAPSGTTPPDTMVRDVTESPANEAVFVGALGKVETDLRPAGKARFGGHLVDVMSQGQFVEAGAVVEVIESRGARIVVRPATPNQLVAEPPGSDHPT